MVAELISQMWDPLLARGTEIGSSYLTLIPGASASDAIMIRSLPFLLVGWEMIAGKCFSGGEVVRLLGGNVGFGVDVCTFILEL